MVDKELTVVTDEFKSIMDHPLGGYIRYLYSEDPS